MRTLSLAAGLASLLLGGAARADVCAPATIGWSVDAPGQAALAADGNLYWLRTPQPCQDAFELARTPAAGGATTRTALLPSSLSDFVVVGGSAFALAAGAVYAVDLSSGATRVIVPAATGRRRAALTADASAVYFFEDVAGDTRLVRAPIDGSASSILKSGICGWHAALAAGSGSLFFEDASGLQAMPIGGGPTETIAASVHQYAVDGSFVVWANASGIFRAPASGGAAVELVAFNVPANSSETVYALAVDAAGIYWSAMQMAQFTGTSTTGIWRSDRNGSNVTQLAGVRATGLVSDGRSLFSVEPYAGLVRRDLACAAGATTAAPPDACAPAPFAPAPTGFVGDGSSLLVWDGGGLDAVKLDGSRAHLFTSSVIRDVRADAAAAYVLDDGGVWRVPRDGSAATQIASGLFGQPWLDDSYVYLLVSQSDERRVPKTGGALQTAPVPPSSQFYGVDARGIYGMEGAYTSNTKLWRRDAASGNVVLVTSGTWHTQGGSGPLALDGNTMYVGCSNAYGDGQATISIADPAPPLTGGCYGSGVNFQYHRRGFAVSDGIQLTSWRANGDGPGPISHYDGVTSTDADGTSHRLLDGHPAYGAAITPDSFVWAADGSLERMPRSCATTCSYARALQPPPYDPTLGCQSTTPPPAVTDGGTVPDLALPPPSSSGSGGGDPADVPLGNAVPRGQASGGCAMARSGSTSLAALLFMAAILAASRARLPVWLRRKQPSSTSAAASCACPIRRSSILPPT